MSAVGGGGSGGGGYSGAIESDVPFISGRWYPLVNGPIGLGAIVGANTIRLIPVFIRKAITITDLGLRVGTASGTNCAIAIYANNPATMRPTGNALAASGNLPTTAAVQTATLGAPVALAAGWYWSAVNADSGSTAFITSGTTNPYSHSIFGRSAAANVISTASNITGHLTVSQTYGTWPDLTAASFTEVDSTGGALPIIKVQ